MESNKYKYKYNPIVGENWRYKANSDKPFKISRTKIELFYNCQRCFYKEVKLGLRKPPQPSWAINSAVDALLKKEMDFCRKENRAHGIFKENGYFETLFVTMWELLRLLLHAM